MGTKLEGRFEAKFEIVADFNGKLFNEKNLTHSQAKNDSEIENIENN